MGKNKEFVQDITNIDEELCTMVYRYCVKSRTC